jgi:Mg2+/Co2+ transporter CorB
MGAVDWSLLIGLALAIGAITFVLIVVADMAGRAR